MRFTFLTPTGRISHSKHVAFFEEVLPWLCNKLALEWVYDTATIHHTPTHIQVTILCIKGNNLRMVPLLFNRHGDDIEFDEYATIDYALDREVFEIV